ncbi:hypothetical protein BU16DRAFT_525895 [Lophium mytilinum]|uniref:Uncharacterized protein n=1 Tax=Lophium mytilinum TaxID=390894 RepID=A0A6A6R027_9PEZI|nr:hypothetical protein BU16DRAFT_525895 [Lophium mytilinum]
MPHLPFSTTPSPPASASNSPPPSIVLQPEPESPKQSRKLFEPKDTAAAYRSRYAAYLAATFNMSREAALAEAEYQLMPRKGSRFSEQDIEGRNS